MSLARPRFSPILLTALLAAGELRGDEASARPAGIYVTPPGGSGGTVRLHGSIPQGIKQTGMGKMMLTGMLAPGLGSKAGIVATLPGAKAAVRVPAGWVSVDFQLGAQPGSTAPSGMDLASMISAASGDMMPPQAKRADEFVLVRMRTMGDAREAQVGTVGGMSGHGGPGKDAVRLVSERVGDAAFHVTPVEALPPGEYAFVFGGQGMGGGPLWDFGVDSN